MKLNLKNILILMAALLFGACGSKDQATREASLAEEEHLDAGLVKLTNMQIQALDLISGPLEMRNLSEVVVANGSLEVPPQGRANVSSVIGANVAKIKVVEGQLVKKGEVLAYLEHPDIIQAQLDYQEAYQQLFYVEDDFKRQEKLYQEKVASGKQYQKAKADFMTLKSLVSGLKMKLQMLNINAAKVVEGEVIRYAAITSPIHGAITEIDIATGQYVDPQTVMFELIDASHVHADLMVYEKDAFKLKKGQRVKFSLSQYKEEIFEAEIISVGKNFEEDRKAVHVHAEPFADSPKLLPGLYIKGLIEVGEHTVATLPEAAIVEKAGKHYIFRTKEIQEKEQIFEQVEVVPGMKHLGFVEVKAMEPLEAEDQWVLNAAYYLLSEMDKEEAEHD
ncbi:efflux RND transporter periplasmic adaptor subunit [Persicobacter diffluens]|uniref:Secretion protein HlyD n=1 Tax=Persicobacter diffluens TaxID=981 RepID=A0AAN4VW49_9BACT|nr:secretion protein HlyD [Persicobacter diffluens]